MVVGGLGIGESPKRRLALAISRSGQDVCALKSSACQSTDCSAKRASLSGLAAIVRYTWRLIWMVRGHTLAVPALVLAAAGVLVSPVFARRPAG